MQGDVFTDRQTEQGSASRPYASRESTNPEELWAQLPYQSFEAPDKRILKLHMDTRLRGARAILKDPVGASPHQSLGLTIMPQSTRHYGLGADRDHGPEEQSSQDAEGLQPSSCALSRQPPGLSPAGQPFMGLSVCVCQVLGVLPNHFTVHLHCGVCSL